MTFQSDPDAISTRLKSKGIEYIAINTRNNIHHGFMQGQPYMMDSGDFITQILIDKSHAKLAMAYLSEYGFILLLNESRILPELQPKYIREHHTVFVYNSLFGKDTTA